MAVMTVDFLTKKDDINKETALLKLNDVGNYHI